MGKASARSCLLAGGKVVLVSRTLAKLEAARTELLEQTGSEEAMVEIEACDCLEVAAIEAFFTKREAGSLHHLVVTLGPAVEGVDKIFSDESTLEKVQAQFGKFNAPWVVAKFGAHKLADGGSFVFFSGTLSRAIMKNASCLGPVNAAIECLGKCLALELGPRLRVNVVSPTLTRTSAVTGGMTPAQQEGMFTGFGKSIPAGRSGEVAEIGHAVAFLLTNNFMTGHILDVDGGKTI
jgi:NAD(P)-dependent dehydrogenase (short-subunit alcohol dehydrogenase family)